jgi:chorismate mutase
MRQGRRLRAASALAVCCAALAGASGCGTGAAPNGAVPGDDGLARLVGLAARRLATADTVAAAKWAGGGSISDPAREKVVLDTASAAATQRGLNPHDVAEVSQVFRDQIEANKAVQYGLFSDWSADPGNVPSGAPDLGQVRPVLDGITGELLDAWATTRATRADAGCHALLDRATDDVERDEHLDDLHRRGLDRALRSICG